MFPRKHGKTQHVEIIAKGIEEAIGKWNTLVCSRCGRQKTLANIKHTRLYGIMCVCGSHSVQADECPGSSDGKHEFYQGSTWRICAHCGTRR